MDETAMRKFSPSIIRCPNCRAEQVEGATECGRCGIIFAKFRPHLPRPAPAAKSLSSADVPDTSRASRLWLQVKTAVLLVDERVNPFVFGGRALVFLALLVWGWQLMTASIASNDVGESFMHLINLPFHEAGHIVFAPFGRFMQVLGGSLGQLLMPLVCLGAFLLQHRNPFGASVALWWLAESLMDLAPYINDARALELVLIGGVTGKDVEDYHDWEYILRTLGWLQHDHTLAFLVHGLGALLMLASCAWGWYLLVQQSRRLA